MTLQRGDVVRVGWPYSDRTGSKVRPAVVVQDGPFNPATESQCGLRYRSVVSCTNLLTIDQRLIAQAIGQLLATSMHKIDVSLKKALGLP
jgi:mRNA-degrading endonuclease toxin of MazEF toxin-antitoxin module